MQAEDWLTDTRISYDTVAESYAEMVRPKFARQPYHRAVLRLFAELVNADGTGKVIDAMYLSHPGASGRRRRMPSCVARGRPSMDR